MYTWSKIRLIMDLSYDEKKHTIDYPEYINAVKDIDPNDSINLATNLSSAWLDYQWNLLYKETNDSTKAILPIYRT